MNFNSEQMKRLKDAIRELDVAMTQIDAQKEQIKQIISDVHDELDLEKKLLRKMAKTYHKQNFATVKIENGEFEAFYENVIEKKAQSGAAS